MKTTELLAHAFGEQLVRTSTAESGDILFCGKDVCGVLELKNTAEALRSLDADELTSVILTSGGQDRKMSFVTESGLYALIFKSRKKEAKAFRKWVTGEVLPAIRKTGRYEAPAPALPVDTAVLAAAVLKEIEGSFAIYRLEKALQDERGWARLLRNHIQVRPNTRHPGAHAMSDRVKAAGFRWDTELQVWMSPRTPYSEDFVRTLFA